MKSVTVLPRVTLLVDGAPLDKAALRSLAALHVRQALSQPAQCEIRFHLQPQQTIAALSQGATLTVRVQDAATTLFAGTITALEHIYTAEQGHHLRVRAYDALHTLRKQQQIQAFSEVTLAEIAAQLLAETGLSVTGAVDSPTFDYLLQTAQTHFDFLVRLAQRCGKYLSVRDDALHLLTLEGTGTPVNLRWRENLLALRADHNATAAAESIHALGWHPSLADVYRAEATTPRTGRTAHATSSALDVGGAGEYWLLDETVTAASQVEALAQAEADYRHAQTLTLYGTAEGDPALRPGAIIDVQNVDSALTGQHVLTETRHSLTPEQGFITEFSTVPPLRHDDAPRSVITYGDVTSIDDPQRLGRVRASLPAYDDIETTWMTVLAAGAGTDKGLMSLPDVADRVLVLLVAGDPSQSVVLGGIYGGAGMPDDGIESGVVQRYTLRTPGGQVVTLDDSRGLLRLENADGSYLEMLPQRVRLHSQRNLTIDAPGRAIVIRGDTVDFQRG